LLDIVIKNGTVATASEVYKGDIGIKDGAISAIGKSITEQATRRIDAEGKIICPGGIDTHAHFHLPFMGTFSADDYDDGTRAAAFGGITSYIDFAYPVRGKSFVEDFRLWKQNEDRKTYLDYSSHMVVTRFNRQVEREMAQLVRLGVTSFKMYMPYRKEGLMVDDGVIYATLKRARELGAVVGIHCENAPVLEYLTNYYLSRGKTAAKYHAYTRPTYVEGEAIRRAIDLAASVDGNLYIPHMSTRMGLEAVNRARAKGQHVYAETTPHYLTFTDSVYNRKDASHFVMSPCIKGSSDREALWRGLIEGNIHFIGSDHCPFTSKQKSMGKDDFTKIPNGVPGIEVIVPLLYSKGVVDQRISLNQFVRLTSTNAAKFFGLYPRKGSLAVGSDADLILIDPKRKVKLGRETLHSKIDYSIYDDVTVTGYPVITISAGDIICEEGEFSAKRGRGRFIKRTPHTSGHPSL
jgi:dihydropyrimidinase